MDGSNETVHAQSNTETASLHDPKGALGIVLRLCRKLGKSVVYDVLSAPSAIRAEGSTLVLSFVDDYSLGVARDPDTHALVAQALSGVTLGVERFVTDKQKREDLIDRLRYLSGGRLQLKYDVVG